MIIMIILIITEGTYTNTKKEIQMKEKNQKALRVDNDLWIAFKIACVHKNISMNERIVEMIVSDIKESLATLEKKQFDRLINN